MKPPSIVTPIVISAVLTAATPLHRPHTNDANSNGNTNTLQPQNWWTDYCHHLPSALGCAEHVKNGKALATDREIYDAVGLKYPDGRKDGLKRSDESDGQGPQNLDENVKRQAMFHAWWCQQYPEECRKRSIAEPETLNENVKRQAMAYAWWCEQYPEECRKRSIAEPDEPVGSLKRR